MALNAWGESRLSHGLGNLTFDCILATFARFGVLTFLKDFVLVWTRCLLSLRSLFLNCMATNDFDIFILCRLWFCFRDLLILGLLRFDLLYQFCDSLSVVIDCSVVRFYLRIAWCIFSANLSCFLDLCDCLFLLIKFDCGFGTLFFEQRLWRSSFSKGYFSCQTRWLLRQEIYWVAAYLLWSCLSENCVCSLWILWRV